MPDLRRWFASITDMLWIVVHLNRIDCINYLWLLLACEAALPQQGRGLRLFGQLLKRDFGASAHIRSIELQRAF